MRRECQHGARNEYGDGESDAARHARVQRPSDICQGRCHVWYVAWRSQSANQRNRVDQRKQLRDVVDVCAGQDRGEGAGGIGDDVVLGIGSRAIGTVRPSFWPPQRHGSRMKRPQLERSRSGLPIAASRAAARASGPIRRRYASRVTVANRSRPSRTPSRQAGRANAVRSRGHQSTQRDPKPAGSLGSSRAAAWVAAAEARSVFTIHRQ